MNIVPLSISYEYDPCDYLKAQEFQLKRDIPDYKKTTDDDLLNMQTGLLGYKAASVSVWHPVSMRIWANWSGHCRNRSCS